MKYFVTGASGFLGGAVARQLLAQGDTVNSLVRDPVKAKHLKDLGARIFTGDVVDKMSMLDPMQGVDGVFHIAGWFKIGASDKSEAEKVNILGTRNVFELMKDLHIPRGVYTSSLAVNSDTHGVIADETYQFSGKHISEYDRTKAAGFQIAQQMIADGLPLIIVLPGLVFGPGDTGILRINIIDFLKKRLPALPAQTAYNWIYIDDVAHGHILAMQKGRLGESYMLAGENHTVVEAFDLAEKVTGIHVSLRLPSGLVKNMSVLMGFIEKVVPIPQTYTAEGLRIFAGVTYLGDNSKARSHLGFVPRPFEERWAATLRHEMTLLGI